jgi:hypothetical protein
LKFTSYVSTELHGALHNSSQRTYIAPYDFAIVSKVDPQFESAPEVLAELGQSCLSQYFRHLKSHCQAHLFKLRHRRDTRQALIPGGNYFALSLPADSRAMECSCRVLRLRNSSNKSHKLSHKLKHHPSTQSKEPQELLMKSYKEMQTFQI